MTTPPPGILAPASNVYTSIMAKPAASTQSLPQTLGELRKSQYTPERVSRSVKDELRDNLITRLRTTASTKESLFPGIVGLRRHGRPADRQRGALAPQLHSARLARPGKVSHSARVDHSARPIFTLRRRFRTARQPVRAAQPLLKEPDRRKRRRHSHRLDDADRSLHRKARHARRHRRRPHRRCRPHQSRALGPRARLRAHHALRPAAPRQPRHLRHQRGARPRRQNSGRALQHHAGRRRAD